MCFLCWFSITDYDAIMQGVVYWQPPKQALQKVQEIVGEPSVSRYGADEGLPELRKAILEKVWSFIIIIYSSSFSWKLCCLS